MVTRTPEQVSAFTTLTRWCTGYRVQRDAEGWPVVRLLRHGGYLEWYDAAHVALWIPARTVRSLTRKLQRFQDVPGLIRHQMGDTEARVLVPAAQALGVAKVGRGRRRRMLSPPQRAAAVARLAQMRRTPRHGASPAR